MAARSCTAAAATQLELQAGVLNLFDTTYLLNFLSIFNGTHYGAPRTWTARSRSRSERERHALDASRDRFRGSRRASGAFRLRDHWSRECGSSWRGRRHLLFVAI
jgi:hypothetical protein